MTPILGIDQGLSGALAVLCGDRVELLCDMPTLPRMTGNGAEVAAHALASWIDLSGARVAWVEVAQVMPSTQGRRGMGTVSSFNFGRAAGVVHGVLTTLGLQINFVRPPVWKKHFGLIGKDKLASMTLAKELYPAAAGLLTRKKDHGRAEAILIAAYGAAQVNQRKR